ncbi:MAG: ABC transporter ATP-binding protein [Chloroflexota bacterium]
MRSPIDHGPGTSRGARPAITVRGLGRRFSSRQADVHALRDVNLEVPSGEFCVLVGPSGCGKTTLLRILAGLDHPSEGTFQLHRYDRDRPSNAMVFQQESIFPWMTVFDNVAYGLRMRGAAERTIRERAGYFIDRVGLAEFSRALPYQLSGGMKQRVSVARAFATDPEILLMDEPFGALDEQTRSVLHDELLKIWDESRKTVVFITHSIEEALVLGDRLVVLTARPGRVKSELPIRFPRPRSPYELRALPEFGEMTYQVWSDLKPEVVASDGRAVVSG